MTTILDKFSTDSRFAIDTAMSITSFKTIETTVTPDAFNERGMKVVSISANDTLTGTGIQKVRLTYLDSNFNQFTEDINLNGTTSVNTVATNIKHVESFETIQVGSDGKAVGIIDLKNLTDATLYARIDAGKNQFFSCVHHVKKGKKAVITGMEVGCQSAGVVQVRLNYEKTTIQGNPIDLIFHEQLIANFDVKKIEFNAPLVVEEGHHIRMTAMGLSGGQIVFGRFSFFEVDV